MTKHICVKFYENQLIINIPSTSVVFTLLPSPLFFFFLLLPCSSSSFLPQSSFYFQWYEILEGLKKPQWARELGREAFCTLAASEGAVDCAHCLGSIMVLLPGRAASGVSFRCQVATLEKGSSNGGVQGQCLSGKPEWQRERVVQPHKIRPASSGPSLLLMPWLSIWWEWKRHSLKGQIAGSTWTTKWKAEMLLEKLNQQNYLK